MRSKLIKTLQFFLFLITGIILLYFAFRGIDLNDLALKIREADYRWVALSLLCATLALVLRTYRWKLLIEPLDEHPKKINIFHAINVGYLANFLFPRIGEITRCGILNRTDRVPVDRLFGTVVVERVIDLLTSALLLCLILILRFDLASGFLADYLVQPLLKTMEKGWLFAIVAFAVLSLCVIIMIFRKQLMQIGAMRKLKDILTGIVNGMKSIKQLRNIKLFIALSLLIFGMYLFQTYFMFFALENTSSLSLGDALFILVLSAIAIILPVQGGIGAYHWIVSMGLTILGIAYDDGLAYATISHSATSVLFILLGTISLGFVFLKKKTS